MAHIHPFGLVAYTFGVWISSFGIELAEILMVMGDHRPK